MTEERSELWVHFLKQVKILKLKSIRAWHRFDKQTGTTRFLKKMALAAALKTITMIMPNAQISLHAQTVHKKTPSKTLIASASIPSAEASYEAFQEYSRERMPLRQADFARDLYETLRENVEEVQDGAKHGRKTKTLKDLFGNDIDPKYYCAIAGLRSLEQTIDKKGYYEYEFLLNCIQNPHACLSVISSLEKNFGTGAKTANIRNKLRDELKKNSSSVCIAVVNSRQNTSSGKHFVFVLPNKVVVDSLIHETDTLKGRVVSFNVDKIAKSDDYFTGTRNTGYLFNITDLSENDLMLMFYNAFTKQKMQKTKTASKSAEVSAVTEKPKTTRRKTAVKPEGLWREVSSKSRG